MIKDLQVRPIRDCALYLLGPVFLWPRVMHASGRAKAVFVTPMADPAAMEDKKQLAIDFANRVSSGDKSAETELIDHYGQGLQLMLLQRTGDRQLANDLFQDTFIIVIERLRKATLDEPEKLGGFIHGTARNLLIGDLRKKARRKTFASSDLVAEAPDSQSGSFEQISQTEEAKIVHKLINEMSSKRDKAVLLRFYINEEDKRNICSDLDLSSIHFNRVLFRARRRFKELLTQYENDNHERIRG